MFSFTGQRKKNELSAYAHFNKDNYAIPGSTTSKMLEDQLLHKKSTRKSHQNIAKPNQQLPSHHKRSSKYANKPCICGSGIKYKKCCSLDTSMTKAQQIKYKQWEQEWT